MVIFQSYVKLPEGNIHPKDRNIFDRKIVLQIWDGGCGCGEPLVQLGMAVAVAYDRQCSKHVSHYIDSNCLLEPLRMDDPRFGSCWFQ